MKGGMSQAKRKSNHEPSMSYRRNKTTNNKTNGDLKDRSSEAAFRDSKTRSVRKGRKPMTDQGTCYQSPASENDTSSSCRRSGRQERLHTTTKHHDNPPQVLPPMFSQFPTLSGWPMWYNPTFPSAPPPWLWSSTACKKNNDKATQVEDAENDHVIESQDHVIESQDPLIDSQDPLIDSQAKISSVADPIANSQDGVHNEIKDKKVSVAIQTDFSEEIETSTKGSRVSLVDHAHQESTHGQENVPFLLSLNDQINFRYMCTILQTT